MPSGAAGDERQASEGDSGLSVACTQKYAMLVSNRIDLIPIYRSKTVAALWQWLHRCKPVLHEAKIGAMRLRWILTFQANNKGFERAFARCWIGYCQMQTGLAYGMSTTGGR